MSFAHLVPLEYFVDLSWIHIAVQVVVHHHRGRVIAGSEADNGQEREASVRRGLPEIDSQPAGETRQISRSP